jgi:hypothetical protein
MGGVRAGALVWKLWLASVLMTVSAAGLASGRYLFSPVYASYSTGTTSISSGVAGLPIPAMTLAEVNGPRVYVILLVPIVLAALPLLFLRRATLMVGTLASTLLLVGFTAITGFSIGIAYIPAASLSLLSGLLAMIWWWVGGREAFSST